MSFVHLHTHSEYSLLDGMSKIDSMVQKAKMLEMPALAVTDHGQLHGALEFYEKAKSLDIKPIIGLEAYVSPGSRFEKKTGDWPYHLTLLAKDEGGYSNLLKLSSLSHLEGFYRKPRVDRELLEKYSEGLIVLSGCPSGELLSKMREGDLTGAEQVASWYADVFPGRYYLEVMEHGIDEFSQLTPKINDLSKKMDLPLVLTQDSHYTHAEDSHAHDVLLCIGTNSTVNEVNRFKFSSNQFYLKSASEMQRLLPEIPEAYRNTLKIAEQVDISLDFARTLLPDSGVPENITPYEYLRQLCMEGLHRRYPNLTEQQTQRLDYELNIIEQTGFSEYMLIVRDLALFARKQKIPMGVRGSAAASIVLYTLDVTDIEPTGYGLVFERFLNPERISMPDVDFDFADDRREEIIRYASERYGRDKVAQICTFGTLGAKAAIRDTGRALGVPLSETDRLARMIPEQLNITIDSALEKSSELAEIYTRDPASKELIDTARSLEGVARHASTHAAGVVISRQPLMDVVPLQRPTGVKDQDALPTTQYAMADVEKIGLLKVDFLGLTNLTILGKAVKIIAESKGEEIDLTKLPDGDKLTAELLASAETFGVFQMESAGMRRYVAELRPENIGELAAMVALFRPGPMEHIPRYIDVKFGKAEAHYPHEDLANILDETNGVITYQDQVLQIARQFAGYTLGQADVMRKAMGKKIPEVMLQERQGFIEGSIAQGYEKETAEILFDLFEPFAGYAFNKAHAFSYATIAYQTAYLKAHYPLEYMTAVLMAAGGSQDRLAMAIRECKRLDIEVLPPDINRSEANFCIDQQHGGFGIRFGLAQIKNVGDAGIKKLIDERRCDGDFLSIDDFVSRINPRDVNKRVIEALAKSGALDAFSDRGKLIDGIDRLIQVAQEQFKIRETGQTSMFDLLEDEQTLQAISLDSSEIVERQLLVWEKEYLGTYLSNHPFQEISSNVNQYVTTQMVDIDASRSGTEVVIAGWVTNVRSLVTRQNKQFAIVTMEDFTNSIDLTVWPELYEENRDSIATDIALVVKAKIRSRDGRLNVVADRIFICPAELSLENRDQLEQLSMKNNRKRDHFSVKAEHTRIDKDPITLKAIKTSDAVETGQFNGDVQQRKLRIVVEETTDENADVRRLRKICTILDPYSGDLPVELVIQRRDGTKVKFTRGTVNERSLDTIVSQTRMLLGVLGIVEEFTGLESGLFNNGLAAASG
tara:strand:+ start:3986 stop:7630 length:3645 start_codon:yes stop_codon:yes gene_type:complete